MKLNLELFERQKESANHVFRKFISHSKAALLCATGYGKTFLTCELILKPFKERKPEHKHLVVCGSTTIKKQWVKDGVEQGLCEVETWQKISRAKRTIECDILVVDEVHKMLGGSKEYIKVITQYVKFKYLLVLTATLTKDQINKLKQLGIPIADTVTEEYMIERGWKKRKIEYNLAVELKRNSAQDDSKLYTNLFNKYRDYVHFIDPHVSDKQLYRVIALSQSKSFEGFIKHDGTILNVAQNEYYRYRDAIRHYKTGPKAGKPRINYKYPYAESYARQRGVRLEDVLGMAVNATKQWQSFSSFVYNNEAKLDVVKEFIEMFPDRKILTFSMTTNFCDKLKDVVGGEVYYGSDNKSNNAILSSFKELKSGCMHTVGKVKEGAHIPGINTIINLSNYSKSNDYAQKVGRAGRNNVDDNIVLNTYCVLHRSYYKEPTIEHAFLSKAQAKSVSEVRWIENLNEIV